MVSSRIFLRAFECKSINTPRRLNNCNFIPSLKKLQHNYRNDDLNLF